MNYDELYNSIDTFFINLSKTTNDNTIKRLILDIGFKNYPPFFKISTPFLHFKDDKLNYQIESPQDVVQFIDDRTTFLRKDFGYCKPKNKLNIDVQNFCFLKKREYELSDDMVKELYCNIHFSILIKNLSIDSIRYDDDGSDIKSIEGLSFSKSNYVFSIDRIFKPNPIELICTKQSMLDKWYDKK
jgi:hypothetical protein